MELETKENKSNKKHKDQRLQQLKHISDELFSAEKMTLRIDVKGYKEKALM